MADVALDCGCTTLVTHQRGERVVHCKTHLHIYKVTARDVTTYTVTRLHTPPGGDAA